MLEGFVKIEGKMYWVKKKDVGIWGEEGGV